MAFRVSLLIPVGESSGAERHGTDERSYRHPYNKKNSRALVQLLTP